MIIEHLVFRPRDDVDDAEVLAADEAVQQRWAPFQTGFLRRTTARGDGGWLVETLWWSPEAADDAARAAAGDVVVAALVDLADPASVTTSRWETLD